MKKYLFISMVAVLALSACTNAEPDIVPPSNLMEFTVEHPATRATATEFEEGDKMGVFVTKYDGDKALPLQISGNYASNICSTLDGNKWVNSPAIYWSEGKFDVYAYYPYSKPDSVDEYLFEVSLDQSTEESEESLNGYEASDLMWAKATAVTQMDAVPLTFSHKMSKVVINLIKGDDYNGDIPEEAVVKIHSTVPAASVDLTSGMVTKNGYVPAQTITAKKLETGVYTAIVVPQRLDNKKPLFEILSHGVSYLVESKFVFRSGVQHTINLTMSNNPEKVRIEIGGEIDNGWQ